MSQSLAVLVAEDETTVASGIAAQLHLLGHRVVGKAGTGAEAIRYAAETHPDAIIMDIIMPDGDGIGAARTISSACPTPVVFLSGHFDTVLLQGVVDVGGMAYLLKPASNEQLQAALSLAVLRFRELKDTQEQVHRLDEALEHRKLLSKAKGLIMAEHGISEQEAHRWLQKEASRANVKLVDLARALIAAGPILTHASKDCRPARATGNSSS